MGLCSVAPTIMIDGKIHSKVNPNEIDSLLGKSPAGKNTKQLFSGPVILEDDGLENVSDLLDI